MKYWVAAALVAVLILILYSLRERFNPATERPSASDKSLVQAVQSYAGTKDTAIVTKYMDILNKFYDDVYVPGGKRSATKARAREYADALPDDKDVKKDIAARLIEYVFLSTETDARCDSGFNYNNGKCKKFTSPTCPSGSTFESTSGKCVNSTTRAKTDPTCPSNTKFDSATGMCAETKDPLPETTPAASSSSGATFSGAEFVEEKKGKCDKDYTFEGGMCKKTTTPTCPSGSTLDSAKGKCVDSKTKKTSEPQCPSGASLQAKDMKCVDLRSPLVEGPPTPGHKSSTSTGGSTNALGPNNVTPNEKGRNIWGPIFSGFGDSSATGGDSSKSNKYPTLLGPNPKPSTRIDGVGIVNPSKNYELAMGGLPSASVTGSEENSQFLPFSRTPGDQDVIPDPYRVAKTFSAANYSSKPAPTPFLTDFSAFQK